MSQVVLWGGLLSTTPAWAGIAPPAPSPALAAPRYTAADLVPIQAPEGTPLTVPATWLYPIGIVGQVEDPAPESPPIPSPPSSPEPLPAPLPNETPLSPFLPGVTGGPLLEAPTVPLSPQSPDGRSQTPSPLPSSQVPSSQVPSSQIQQLPEGPTPAPPKRSACDPELGCLRLTPAPLPLPTAPKAPVAYLIGQVDYYRSSNIFAGIDPVNDGFVRPGLTLSFAPPLGPATFLATSVDGGWFRYNDEGVNNLDEFRVNAALFQRVSPVMFVGLGWTNQKYYYSSNIPLEVDLAGNVTRQIPAGTRFFNENSVRLELSRRDRLSPKLSLSTFYQLRVIFAQPFSTRRFYSEDRRDRLGTTEDRSRILNTFVASLNYDLQPNLQAGLDYQFSMANFTRQSRDDFYHQISARLNYSAFRNTQFKVYGGVSFGESSRSDINFNGIILGVSVSVNLALF